MLVTKVFPVLVTAMWPETGAFNQLSDPGKFVKSWCTISIYLVSRKFKNKIKKLLYLIFKANKGETIAWMKYWQTILKI